MSLIDLYEAHTVLLLHQWMLKNPEIILFWYALKHIIWHSCLVKEPVHLHYMNPVWNSRIRLLNASAL